MRSFKKLLAVILTVALVLNVNLITASASESIKVSNIYTNFQKATMSVGTTKQIKITMEPENATYKGVSYVSSDHGVVTVSGTGLITAVAPGSAVITVSAKNNSKASEKITIKVLEDLVIDKKLVDADNEVLVLDGVYGNVYIQNTVGDAQIYLSEMDIKNKLVLEQGDYQVFLYDTSAKSVEVKETLDDIVSLTTAIVPLTPFIHVVSNSHIDSVSGGTGLNLSQDPTSFVGSLAYNFIAPPSAPVLVTGFQGSLMINNSCSDSITLGFQSCLIPTASIMAAPGSGPIQMNNMQESTIGSMTLGGSPNLNLQVPTDMLSILPTSSGAHVNVSAPVGNLSNNGSNTNLLLGAVINFLSSTGSGASIQLMLGGMISENTTNTPVTHINESGTIVMVPGVNAPVEVSAPISYNVGDVILENNFDDGRISLIKNNSPVFIMADTGNNSSKSLLIINRTQPWYTPAISLAAYVPSIAGKHITVRVTADVMYNSGEYSTQQFKCTVNGSYDQVAATTVNKGQWGTLTGTFEVSDAYSLIYFETVGDGSNTMDNFYLDNVKVEIAAVRDIVKVSGVSIQPAAATLGIGQSQQLTANITPAGAENTAVTWISDNPLVAWVSSSGVVTAVGGGTANIYVTTADGGFKATGVITVDPTKRVFGFSLDKGNKTLTTLGETVQLTATATLNNTPYAADVTWASDDVSVATVSPTGLVTAIKNGSANITASTVCDDETITDTFKVTVNDKIVVLQDFEDKAIGTAADGYMNWYDGECTASVQETVIAGKDYNNRALKVLPTNYNAAPVLNVSLPAGTTLADYSKIEFKLWYKAGDVTYKPIFVEANTALSSGFGANTTNQIVAKLDNNLSSTQPDFLPYSLSLNGVNSHLSGTFKIALGINCGASLGGEATTYYIDDIVLVKKVPTNELLSADFEDGVDPFTAAWDTTTEGGVHNWGTKNVVTDTGVGYDNSNGCYEVSFAAGEDYRGVGFHFASAGTYTISAKVKNAVAETEKVRLLTSTYSQLGGDFVISNNSWTDVTYTFTLDAATSVIIAPQYKDAEGATPAYHYYIDNLVITKQ